MQLGFANSGSSIGSIQVGYLDKKERIRITSANSLIRTIFEEACKVFGITNADDFVLMLGRSKLDLSLPFRLSGISLLDKLEIHRNESKEGPRNLVKVQLVLDQGTTIVQDNVPCSTKLSDLLSKFDLEAIVYMRSRVEKFEFDQVTLEGLGIYSGTTTFRAITTNSVQESMIVNDYSPPSARYTILDIEECVKIFKNERTEQEYRAMLKTMHKISHNLLKRPDDDSIKRINSDNPGFFRAIGKYETALKLLFMLGFQLCDTTFVIDCVDQPWISQVYSLIHAELVLLEAAHQPPPFSTPSQDAPMATDFDPFKSQVTRVVPQPRSAQESSTEINVRRLETKKSQILKNAGIPERQVFIVESMEKIPKQVTEPEGVVSESDGDSKLLFQATKTMNRKQEEAQQFQTKSMRELEILRKSRVFVTTIIRVVFPDKAVLQATFSPSETVGDVKRLVMECVHLQEPPRMYVSPPMQVLEDEMTLESYGFVPGAIVYVSGDMQTQQYVSPPESITAQYPKSISMEEESSPSTEAPPTAKKGVPKWFKAG